MEDIKSYPIYLKATVKFEIHLRYQPCIANGTYAALPVGNQLEVFYDTESRNLAKLFTFNSKFRMVAMPFSAKLENLLYRDIDDPTGQYDKEFIGPDRTIKAVMP